MKFFWFLNFSDNVQGSTGKEVIPSPNQNKNKQKTHPMMLQK